MDTDSIQHCSSAMEGMNFTACDGRVQDYMNEALQHELEQHCHISAC